MSGSVWSRCPPSAWGPCLVCLSMHYGQHCQPFSCQKCTILQDFAHTISNKFPGGDTLGPLQKRPRCMDPDTNFRMARQRSHCSDFYEMTNASRDILNHAFNKTSCGRNGFRRRDDEWQNIIAIEYTAFLHLFSDAVLRLFPSRM